MDSIGQKIENIKRSGGYRELRYIDSAQGSSAVIDGIRVLLLSSNNYLGLCNDERLKEAAIEAVKTYGVGSGGSRLTTGSMALHRELEERIASFKKRECGMVYNTGYMANLGTISGLTDESWTVFSDRLNHASIVDGCRLSKAKFVVYKHCDIKDLEKKLKRYKGKSNLVVTDGVFSMDGNIAPLKDILSIAKRNGAMTMVDDAHATGVIGEHGRGTEEYLGLEGEVDIQMGTLSKALGGEGGFIASRKEIVEYLRHRAKSFVYSTALSPATLATALASISIVESESFSREKLRLDSAWFRAELQAMGFSVPDGVTPIIPILVGDSELGMEFSRRLMESGIYIPCIRPPTVPKNTSRLRVTIMATHKREELEWALEVLKDLGAELGITRGVGADG